MSEVQRPNPKDYWDSTKNRVNWRKFRIDEQLYMDHLEAEVARLKEQRDEEYKLRYELSKMVDDLEAEVARLKEQLESADAEMMTYFDKALDKAATEAQLAKHIAENKCLVRERDRAVESAKRWWKEARTERWGNKLHHKLWLRDRAKSARFDRAVELLRDARNMGCENWVDIDDFLSEIEEG